MGSKRYVVFFRYEDKFEAEFYTASDFDSAEAECRKQNPEDIEVLLVARDPNGETVVKDGVIPMTHRPWMEEKP